MSDEGNGNHRVTRTISRLATAVSGVVLTAAGVYVVIYLARWEWNRAIVSATVFIAMLQVLSTAVLASRLRALTSTARVVIVNTGADQTDVAEAATGAVLGTDMGDAVAEALGRANDDHAARWFEWLRGDSGRTAVFIPVLLGTGMILSAVAWLVERAAGLVARRTIDPTAATTVPLHLPLGADLAALARPVRTRHGRSRRWATAFLVAVTMATAGIGVEAVRRLTQSTRDAPARHGRTELVVAARSLDERSAADIVIALWAVCRERLDQWPSAAIAAIDGADVTLQLDRALSRTAQRRTIGCFEDFTLERVLGTVVRLDVVDDERKVASSVGSSVQSHVESSVEPEVGRSADADTATATRPFARWGTDVD